jgi:phosphoglycerol geranylgeranyltransferase
MPHILPTLQSRKASGRKSLAVLVDPDKNTRASLETLCRQSADAGVDYFLAGSSLLLNGRLEETVAFLKQHTPIPVVLFPGNVLQVCPGADAILFLSLISGRNPDLLIGQQVHAAPLLKHSGLEVIPTGYLLVDGGHPTSASYMSHTLPIPADKEDIASATALAGTYLGMQAMYLDAGSGARIPVNERMLTAVAAEVSVPLFAGGGLRTPERALAACQAGADVVVVGNAIENDSSLVAEMAAAVQSAGPVRAGQP